jgi:signal transduction histidine kinase/CheY-like chemotaxis protein
MVNKKILVYLLGIFIVTIVLIVFLQYNSNRNVNQLIAGNQDLLTEFRFRIALHNLREDLYYLSGEERKMLNQNSNMHKPEIIERKKKIWRELGYIKNLTIDGHNKENIKEIDSLVTQFMSFYSGVPDSFPGNRNATVNAILVGRPDSLLNKVIETSRRLNISRDEYLANLIETADKNGIEAKKWGIILAILAIVASIYAFGFISNKIRIQQQLIKQLNESEKKGREAATIKENFMANMSHEIRTPMNAILGFTQLLQKQTLDEVSKEYVRSIQSSSENLLAIVNDVLDFSKIEAGMMRIEVNPFSLRGLLHSLETMFSEKAKEKKLLLSVDADDLIPDVLMGDPVRLTQILVNLVGNALKFTSSGSIIIRVSMHERRKDSVRICFSVRDTGIGIPQSKIGYIFERFNQADEDTTRKFGGTGLGLSIVKQLVELQKGTVKITSEENRGTEVRFILPYEIMKQEILPQDPKDNSRANLFQPIKNISVLVVEDNVMNQNLVKHLFAGWKLEFQITSNGREAIEALQNHQFDLVLMDIQMPEMDGYTATQKIRNELHNSIPIIAMTAHAMAGEREKCLSYGMNEYLSKPLRENELYNLIKRLGLNESVHKLRIDEKGTLDFQYLEELSGGNVEFKKNMISQFLVQGKSEVLALETAFVEKNYSSVKNIAHNLKTSVSFMGLTDKLDSSLSYIEDRVLFEKDSRSLAEAISYVKSICNHALQEAKNYQETPC